MEKETIMVNKDGVLVEANVMGTFASKNGNEYLVYSFDDDIQVSKLIRNGDNIQLDFVPSEDEEEVDDMLENMMEGL
ncbi:MAG: DUF1292 domain-containing protein [Bacilli bacterium]|nr:DUF1292 domain-containing protein [Bacilli bacterium]